jgi:hypothetical protein
MSAPLKSTTAAERHTAGRIVGAWITKTKADEFALTMKPVLLELEIGGITGRTDVANALNDRGYSTPRGKRWVATTVTNLVGRIAVIKVAA